jgi:hypothetical protein
VLAEHICLFGLSTTGQDNFLSKQTDHQSPVSSTFLSQQTNTSHEPNEQAD